MGACGSRNWGLIALLLAAFVEAAACAFTSPLQLPANRRMASAAGAAAATCIAQGGKRVAVVGAGAAGLAAAKEMRRQGHDVTVIEQATEVGGVWCYDESVEDDPLSKGSRRAVHSSMYHSLRTNLPREVMSYSDFPFDESFSPLRYPPHTVVRDYLAAYAEANGIMPLVSLGRRVASVEPLPGGGWAVRHCSIEAGGGEGGGGECTAEEFDAVAVCNGHYSASYVPEIPGIENFRGGLSHSHNYRTPDPYAGKKVVIVGASNSGEDLAQEVSKVASEVFMTARAYLRPEWGRPGSAPTGPRGNIWRWQTIQGVRGDGALELEGGDVVEGADHIIFCTGYRYAFPFLREGREISVDDNMITPLYQHMFPARHPTMAFIGLPAKIVPFPQFELQSRLAAMVWAGRVRLPPQEEMEAEIMGEVAAKERAGVPRKYFHVQGGGQFPYNDMLSKLTGSEPLPLWRRLMYEDSGRHKRERPWDYRDAPLGTLAEYRDKAARITGSDQPAYSGRGEGALPGAWG